MSCRNPSKIAKDFWVRLVLYLLYSFIGSFIFLVVENRPYNDFQDNLKTTLENVHCNFSMLRNSTTTVISNMTDQELIALAKRINDINSIITDSPEKWNFDRAFRLTFEIMSTIGYGSTPPKTQAGRLIAVFYTLFGIPIFLFLLKSIGEVINRQISKAITYFEKRALKREEPENVELKVLVGFTFLLFLDVLLEAVFLMIQKNFSFIDGIYTVIITATTVGFGDIMLENEMTMVVSLSLLSTVLDGASCYAEKTIEEQRAKRGCQCFGKNQNTTEDGMESYGKEKEAIDHEQGKENIANDQERTEEIDNNGGTAALNEKPYV